jgi:hypothetical protein
MEAAEVGRRSVGLVLTQPKVSWTMPASPLGSAFRIEPDDDSPEILFVPFSHKTCTLACDNETSLARNQPLAWSSEVHQIAVGEGEPTSTLGSSHRVPKARLCCSVWFLVRDRREMDCCGRQAADMGNSGKNHLFVGEPRRAFAALADLAVAEAVAARFLGTPGDFSPCAPARVLGGPAWLAAPN